MMNINQFATICIQNYAMRMAGPGMAGPNFSWTRTFPEMAVGHVRTQWLMANRSERVLEKNLKRVERIAVEIGSSFAEITGKK